MKASKVWERFSHAVSEQAGRPWAFGLALVTVVLWLASGPLFGFSNTWQLIINTSTTIITFLMVFVIQHGQNKDSRAMELKLNELIASIRGASNRLIAVEELSDEELAELRHRYDKLIAAAVDEERDRRRGDDDDDRPRVRTAIATQRG